jgi:hypothetical protein
MPAAASAESLGRCRAGNDGQGDERNKSHDPALGMKSRHVRAPFLETRKRSECRPHRNGVHSPYLRDDSAKNAQKSWGF